jgi:hypothetical protein
MPIVRSIQADTPGGALYLVEREVGEPGRGQVRPSREVEVVLTTRSKASSG